MPSAPTSAAVSISMVDPHLMLLLMQLLGRGYIVWDQAARFNFRKPGKGIVSARIAVSEEELSRIRAATADDEPCRPVFEISITDAGNEVVAQVSKALYVRRKVVNTK